jgi:hypothetical protein
LIALLLFALMGPTAQARRPSAAQAAEDLVDQLIDQTLNGQVRRGWIRQRFREANPQGTDAANARRAEAEIARDLAPGGELYKRFVQSSLIYGSIEGPDYIRVVLEKDLDLNAVSGPRDWFTVVVENPTGRPRIREWGFSSCGLCSEPERFVRDLFEEVDRVGDAAHRLLPGLELVVSAVHPDNEWKRDRWIWAYVNRAAGAQYTTRALRGAKVLGSRSRQIQVNLKTGQETWPVLYLRERWWLDYGGLSANSVWTLRVADVEKWTQPDTVRKARLANWQPGWRLAKRGVQVSDGALFIAQRNVQEDLLLYDQDIGRRWALWAFLDENSGAVHARIDAPRLSRRMFVDTLGWPDLFRFTLSPDGRLFSVSAKDRVWAFDLDQGTTLWTELGVPGGGVLAFSADGLSLAVLDRAIGGLQIYSTRDFSRQSRARGPRGAVDMLWLEEGLLVLTDQALAWVSDGKTREALSLDCQGAKLAVLPGKNQALVFCPGTVSELLQVNTHAITEPPQSIPLLGERKSGDFAVSPAGKWAVLPAQAHQKEGMCLFNLESGQDGPCFAKDPLRQVRFSADGANLLGIDHRGRAWKWTVRDLF